MDPRNLWRTAQLLLRQFGADALLHADARLDAGDLAGRRTWLQIRDAIDQLSAAPPPGTPLN